ncbi:glycosyltransferase family 2 protein [Salinimicrobium sp. CAU 1759]
MSKENLLSIITINRNNYRGLSETVGSVLEQTWQDFEYIVIDGGSTDGSKEFIESKKHQLHFWCSEPDAGIYDAMNKGLSKSSGEYLLFLNSGDTLVDKEILTTSKEFLDGRDLVYFDLEMYDHERRFVHTYPDILAFSHFLHQSLPHPATFIKRSLLQKADGFDESFKIVSDWKFFLNAVCKENCSYLHVNKCLSRFDLFGISSSGEMKERIKEERRQVLQEGYSAFLQDYEKLEKYERAITDLRRSRKIKLLLKFHMLNEF